MVQSTVEKLSATRVKIAITVTPDELKPSIDHAYKHIAESRNRVYARPGFFYDYARQADAVRTIGPTVKFSRFPMPKQFAFLALFVESHVQFFTHGTDRSPRFGQHEDDGCSRIFVAHGLLGGGKIRWSDIGQGADQPFLFVYTEPRGRDPGGVHMIIVGDELDIEADGIVG